MDEQKKIPATIEGFTLSGEEVAQLTDKRFTINAEPKYVNIDDNLDPTKKIRKLIVPVTLSNGTQVDWFANKTSQKVIIAMCGRILSKWIGFKGQFDVQRQRVGKEEREVIYVLSQE
jgi:hypothetical protein